MNVNYCDNFVHVIRLSNVYVPLLSVLWVVLVTDGLFFPTVFFTANSRVHRFDKSVTRHEHIFFFKVYM